MIVFPNCKINLGLRILQKRSDGYHDLETVFYPIALHDILEIIPLKSEKQHGEIPFSLSGLTIDGDTKSNLCMKAYELLKATYPRVKPVQIHLHKVTPAGSGLGGGSSDAAFTLKMLDKIFELNLSTDQLIKLALELGSDCPFFIVNRPCLSTGRGERLEETDLDLSPYKLVLVKPDFGINTREAFAGITLPNKGNTIKEIIKKPVDQWKNELRNDFENIILPRYPAIAGIKDELYRAGALYASLSGSGSAVFGIFSNEQTPVLTFPSGYFVRELTG